VGRADENGRPVTTGGVYGRRISQHFVPRRRPWLRGLVALLVSGCLLGADSLEGARPPPPKVAVDHTVAPRPARPLADTGPAPGVLQTAWTIRLPPDEEWTDRSRLQVPYALVYGQVVVASTRGVDAYDAITGRPRWHYRERGRWVRDVTVAGGAIVLWTDAGDRPPATEVEPASDAAHLVGLDAATGWLLWRRDDQGQPHRWRLGAAADPLPAGAGVVATESPDEHDIVGLDARTGIVRWTMTAGSGCEWPYGGAGDGGGPVELGGVPATDWPDACRLAPGYRVRSGRWSDVTIGRVELRKVRCEYDIGAPLHQPMVTVAWAAATPEQAKALLAEKRGVPARAGDEASFLIKGEWAPGLARDASRPAHRRHTRLGG
jgi:hypothetical protein